jgi:hypothetical protein
MKHLLKYIFLLITICVIATPVEAKKKQRKKQKTSITKKKTSKKKNNRTIAANAKTTSINKVNLNELLNETTVTVAPTKSDSVPEKVVTILSAFTSVEVCSKDWICECNCYNRHFSSIFKLSSTKSKFKF